MNKPLQRLCSPQSGWYAASKLIQDRCDPPMAQHDEMLSTRQACGCVHISSLTDTAGTLRKTLDAYNSAYPLLWEMLERPAVNKQKLMVQTP